MSVSAAGVASILGCERRAAELPCGEWVENSSPANCVAGEDFPKLWRELLAEIQLLEHALVAVGSGALEIIEKLAAARHHLKEAAARGVIFDVRLEVLG